MSPLVQAECRVQSGAGKDFHEKALKIAIFAGHSGGHLFPAISPSTDLSTPTAGALIRSDNVHNLGQVFRGTICSRALIVGVDLSPTITTTTTTTTHNINIGRDRQRQT